MGEGGVVPLGQILTDLALADPDRPIVTCGNETATRAGLEARANRLARTYRSRGVGPGDFVTVGLPNGIGFYAVVFALWKLGAVPQLISPRLPDAERAAIIDLAKPVLVVTEEAPDPGLSDAYVEPRVGPSWKAPTSGGSTGRPKLIVSGQRGELDPAATASLLSQRDGGVQLVPGPLYHNAPFNFSMYGLFAGQHLVVLEKFHPVSVLEAVQKHRVDWVSLVPTMMLRVLRELEKGGSWDLGSLEQVWHGAAPCPAWLKETWFDLVGAANVHEMYGTTEGQMMTHIDGVEWLAHRGSVGRPLWGEVKILGPDLAELPAGELGEVYTRPGPDTPPYRYVGAEPRRAGEWESVGDLGRLDADGYLYLSDRRTDLIITGGANVYPAEVEAAISEHPSVLDCAVVGLLDEDLGRRVHAVVQAAVPLTADDLRAFLAERLVRYKIPRTFRFTDRPPRDDAGKLRRTALTEHEASY
ncbi:AMP-binding protein [Actinomadura syzygii]|uniref:AMP-binding protein n=1 Tax=Actinomadura syzygii TaxID=1427538 RepID=A0A5D0TWP4_9ACTN|nr:AMP-binding protein [Actinomadura syzygii]TYC09830.1 AMP-binding protein [Actinomadura syzygii]